MHVAACYKRAAIYRKEMKIKTNFREVAENYLKACRAVAPLIEATGREPQYYISGLGLSRTTYYNRLKAKDWTVEELIRIGELIENA